MQSEGPVLAEVSCLKKLQLSQNELQSAHLQLQSHDVEKTEVNNGGSSYSPVVETPCNPPSNEKGILEQNNAAESDNSSDTDEEKDDFPEGGLRG